MARKHGSNTISVTGDPGDVDIDVDVSDILPEISDEDLVKELESRGKPGGSIIEYLDDLRSLVARRDTIGALAMIDRLMTPPTDMAARYTKWKESRATPAVPAAGTSSTEQGTVR